MISVVNPQALPTPNIDRLARNGILFRDAYSCTNATDPSITTMMTGLHPARHGIVHHGGYVTSEEIAQVRRVPTLVEFLNQAGYTTIGIDWLGRWHKQGFDIYSGITKRSIFSSHLIKYLDRYNLWKVANRVLSLTGGKLNKAVSALRAFDDARLVVDRAIDLLRLHCHSPFFLFIHFWDLHAPYRPISRFISQVPKNVNGPRLTIRDVLAQLRNPLWRQQIERWTGDYTYVDEFVAAYQSEVLFVDEQLGRLWDAFKQLGLDNNTLIILTSDHGESFYEHGICFDHHGLYEATVHVPLILHAPNSLPGGIEVKGLVQHTDLMPTLLELLNLSCPSDLDGTSLLPMIADATSHRSVIYLEETLTQHKVAVRTKRYKYIRALSEQDAICRYCGIVHGGLEELYDLEQDPNESKNIAQEKPDVREELCKQVSGWLETSHRSRDLQPPEVLSGPSGLVEEDDDEQIIVARLRDLGYL